MPLAAIRPDEWNVPLFLHVLGALLLVGALVTAVGALVVGWRRDDPAAALALNRLGFQSLLLGAIPSYLVMRVGAEWIATKEGVDGDIPWVGIGYLNADLGVLLLPLTILLAGLGVRRMGKRGATHTVLGRIATVLASLLLAGYNVAIWAMTAKPT